MRSAAQGGQKAGVRQAVSFAVRKHRRESVRGWFERILLKRGRKASLICDKCRRIHVAMLLWRRAGKCVFFACVLANGAGVW